MPSADTFLTGVVEGFYGRQWSHEMRLAYAGYLAAMGLNTSLYCPKGDPWLRRDWQQPYPPGRLGELRQLSDAHRRQGVNWGVGLSPFELYRHYGAAEKEQLRRKLGQLQSLEAPLLAILFDDMPGDLDALAERQAEIVADVCAWMPGVRVLACPTYYSFDPVLEKVFGVMPVDYWPQLGAALPAAVDVFWTGNLVCSEAVTVADVEAICGQLGRPVILWDNYPVNDGARRSKYLYTAPLAAREAGLAALLSGHLCNPMNQALLSLPALAGLAALYGRECGETYLSSVLGDATWAQLRRDGPLFQSGGLEEMSPQQSLALAAVYGQLPGLAAAEVAGWLRGEYTFDPACLTD